MKQRINIGIDLDVYLQVKQARINLSETINFLLKQFMSIQPNPTEQLYDDLKKAEKKLMESKAFVDVIKAKIQAEENKQTEEQKKLEAERIDKADLMIQSLKAAGVHDFD